MKTSDLGTLEPELIWSSTASHYDLMTFYCTFKAKSEQSYAEKRKKMETQAPRKRVIQDELFIKSHIKII